LNFQFSPNFFPDIPLPIPTPMWNFKRIRQHLQLENRERKIPDAEAERWLNQSTLCTIRVVCIYQCAHIYVPELDSGDCEAGGAIASWWMLSGRGGVGTWLRTTDTSCDSAVPLTGVKLLLMLSVRKTWGECMAGLCDIPPTVCRNKQNIQMPLKHFK
jgi:hypothetical protein